MSLDGKRILVTGGSSGIGQAVAIRVASDGARTAILDVAEGSKATTLQQIDAGRGEVRFWRADVAHEEEVAAAVDESAKWLGGIDALLHCAGVMRGQGVDLRQLNVDTWLDVLAVNLTGTFFVAKHVARHMIAAQSGVIVLVASVGGVTTGSGSYAYGASKGGMHGFALTLDMHLAAHGIRVHDVCPDSIDTPMYRASVEEGLARGMDPGRYDDELGTPAEVAELLAFLVTDEASYLPLTLVARRRAQRDRPG